MKTTKKNSSKNKLDTLTKEKSKQMQDMELHVARLKEIKTMTGVIFESWAPDDKAFNATIALILRSFFDFLCAIDKELSIADIRVFSEVIQRLMNCYATIKSIEMRSADHKIREEEAELRKQKIRATLHDTKERKETLSPETLEYIEENLRFI